MSCRGSGFQGLKVLGLRVVNGDFSEGNDMGRS